MSSSENLVTVMAWAIDRRRWIEEKLAAAEANEPGVSRADVEEIVRDLGHAAEHLALVIRDTSAASAPAPQANTVVDLAAERAQRRDSLVVHVGGIDGTAA